MTLEGKTPPKEPEDRPGYFWQVEPMEGVDGQYMGSQMSLPFPEPGKSSVYTFGRKVSGENSVKIMSSDETFVAHDLGISGTHMELEIGHRESDGLVAIRIKDLNSSNGIKVDGNEITPNEFVNLNGTEVITLGRFTFGPMLNQFKQQVDFQVQPGATYK